MEEIGVLARVALFQGLADSQIERILRHSKRRQYKEEEIIIQEGDRGDCMFILVAGRVQVSRTLTLRLSEGGFGEGEKSFTQLDGEGHPLFGEGSLLVEDSVRGATVTALTPCEVLEIHHNDFETLCREDPDLAYKVFRNMARELNARLRRTNQDVLKLTTALSIALSGR